MNTFISKILILGLDFQVSQFFLTSSYQLSSDFKRFLFSKIVTNVTEVEDNSIGSFQTSLASPKSVVFTRPRPNDFTPEILLNCFSNLFPVYSINVSRLRTFSDYLCWLSVMMFLNMRLPNLNNHGLRSLRSNY